jgi:hypothetical protein
MNFEIFAEEELRAYLEHKAHAILSKLEQENGDYLLNINEDDYVQHMVAGMSVDPLVIHADQIYVSSSERMISATHFPRSFHDRAGGIYKRNVVTFHIPVSGTLQLLRTAPSSRIMWATQVNLNQNEISFDVINFQNDASAIAKEKDSVLGSISNQLVNVNDEVDRFNSQLESRARRAVQARKEQIQRHTGVLCALGIPIKKTSDVAETFAVPAPKIRKRLSVEKPSVHDSSFIPEPTLPASDYMDILQMIHDVCKNFERLPSTYADKEEEQLRDHILMFLEPNFAGSATGETFNKSGKTDILLRHEGSNIFIAECKFWKGAKSFGDAVSQLLGYLTWRDSKAAVIVFVRNKDFTQVLQTADQEIAKHPNYLKLICVKEETWSIHHVHLNDDRNRIVNLAVMLYHLPS